MGGVSRFTRLLVKISGDLVTEDVKMIKHILRLDDRLCARELEEASTGIDIFQVMKSRGLLGPTNLVLLKSVLEIINEQLLEQVIQFEKSQQPVPASPSCVQETGLEGQDNFSPSSMTRVLKSTLSNDVAPSTLDFDDTNVKTMHDRHNPVLDQVSATPGYESFTHQKEQRSMVDELSLETNAKVFLVSEREPVETDGDGGTLIPKGHSRSVAEGGNRGSLKSAANNTIRSSDKKYREFGSVDRSYWETVYERVPSASCYPSVRDVEETRSVASSDQASLYLMEEESVDGKAASLCSFSSRRPSDVSIPDSVHLELVTGLLRDYQLGVIEPSPQRSNNSIGAPDGSRITLTAAFDAKEHWGFDSAFSTPERLGENQRELSTPVPPTVSLRDYQLELAEPSLQGLNNIICAPTGSGKTLTAAYIYQERLKLAEEGNFRGLFIVCQRTLVLQQKKALEEFLGRDVLVGSVDENQLLKEVLLIDYQLVVLTAQKLINALETSSVKIYDFGMIIMDECHHTDLNHPYNKIMRIYHQLRIGNRQTKLPMIVGLTASLGVGTGKDETAAQMHYINICANLDCERITYVRDRWNMAELLHFNPKPTNDQIKSVDPRPKDSPFYTVMTSLMGKIETATGLICTKPQQRGTQQYENWSVSRRQEAVAREDLPHIIVACEVLERLNVAWMLHDQLQIKDAKEVLDSHFTDDWLPLTPLPIQVRIMQWYTEASDQLDELVEDETIDKCPQLYELCKLLRHLHGSHADARGILLARTKLSVDRLIRFLEEQSEFQGVISPAKFVGQAGSEGSMTQNEQENTLRRFRLGREDPSCVNLLVATDIAQEGLDMPKCNYVIRYNFVSNEIGSVQSRGRARAPKSELYLIVTRGSVNEKRELENLQKEHQMQEALRQIDKIAEERLKKAIKAMQDKNWSAYQNQLERNRARASAVDPRLVTIHCSKCKVYLCKATDIYMRGSNYICTDPEFEKRIYFRATASGREFISEVHLGDILCKGEECPRNKLGLKIQYKQGQRMHGLVLGREGCVWKVKDKREYMTIKQWSKVPFAVEIETI